ncbi:MAG: hypothetical protein JW716_04900 [Candidatus Aenigmarchaeota archaeon]|nr:hypothetical protein [Candidatus Aenigmarchaeota archaeon]
MLPRKLVREESVIDGRTFSRCYLAGSMASTVFLIAYFAHNEFVAFFMGIFLAWSILMVFDAILPYHRRFHGLNGSVALILGVIAAIILSPYMYIYFIILLIASIAVYSKPVKNFLFPKRISSKDDEE